MCYEIRWFFKEICSLVFFFNFDNVKVFYRKVWILVELFSFVEVFVDFINVDKDPNSYDIIWELAKVKIWCKTVNSSSKLWNE